MASCLIAHFALAIASAARKSITFDETAHVIAGMSYWHFDDYRLQPENGNLPQRLIALPILGFADYDMPSLDQPAWSGSDVWTLGSQFLFGLGNDLNEITMLGRGAIAFLSSALCLTIFLWSRRIFGLTGGLVSLTLASFSPTLLAHGRLMTSDTCYALFFLLSIWSIWSLLQRVSLLRLGCACLSLAGLFLTKASAVLILPIAALMTVWSLVRRGSPEVVLPGRSKELEGRGLRLLALGAVVVLLTLTTWTAVWGAYGFRYSAANPQAGAWKQFHSFEDTSAATAFLGSEQEVIDWVDAARLLPEAWTYGVAAVAAFGGGRNAFLNGQYSETGWWYYFPYAVLVKTPIPLFVLLLVAIATLHRRRGYEAVAPLILALVVLWPTYLASNLNIGHRHVLATYPIAFILAGAVGHWLDIRNRSTSAIVVLCLALFVADSSSRYPHYLSYFNQIVKPEQAWRHLVDSNLDWGQDLPALQEYLQEHSSEQVYLGYFGTADPRAYGLDATLLDRDRLGEAEPGLYCISATQLQAVNHKWRGVWGERHEHAYGKAIARVSRYQARGPEEFARLEQANDPQLFAAAEQYAELRMARLLAYLRRLQPIAMAGHSILIFDVTQEHLDAAFAPSRT